MTGLAQSRGPTRRVLITGGTGFIGVNLAAKLVEDGASVSVFARRVLTPDRAPDAFRDARVVVGDIRDALAVKNAVEDVAPDIVLHLASTPFNPPPTNREHLDVIVGGTSNVLAAIVGIGRVRLVHAGSGAEYGSGSLLHEDAPLRPSTSLGAAKAAATHLVQAHVRDHAIDAVILRLFTPYGPWDRPGRLVTHAALLADKGADVPVSDGRQRRDFVYIDDVVDAFVRASVQAVARGTVLNICSGHSLTVREVVEVVQAAAGRGGKVLAGVLPTRPDEIWELSGNNQAAAATLGWRAETSFHEGVRRTVAWIQAHRMLFDASPTVNPGR